MKLKEHTENVENCISSIRSQMRIEKEKYNKLSKGKKVKLKEALKENFCKEVKDIVKCTSFAFECKEEYILKIMELTEGDRISYLHCSVNLTNVN